MRRTRVPRSQRVTSGEPIKRSRGERSLSIKAIWKTRLLELCHCHGEKVELLRYVSGATPKFRRKKNERKKTTGKIFSTFFLIVTNRKCLQSKKHFVLALKTVVVKIFVLNL